MSALHRAARPPRTRQRRHVSATVAMFAMAAAAMARR